MKALVFDGQNIDLDVKYPKPVPAPDEALVRVNLAAICNTDREIMGGYSPGFRGVMGHEFVGVVEAVGSEVDSALADKLFDQRVVGEINLSCFRQDCFYCMSGSSQHCEQRRVLGIHNKDGCFADYLTLPVRLLHLVPRKVPDKEAIFIEPLAAAMRIVEQVHTPPTKSIALVGDGRLAYMIAQVIALSNAPFTIFGIAKDKLKMFKDYGQTKMLEPIAGLPSPVGDEDKHAFDIVIDATGSPTSLATSLALTRSQGTLVMKSTYANNAEINMSEVVVREINILGSRCGPYQPALRFLELGLIKLPALKTFDPMDFEAAFKSQAFKVAFDFED